MGKATRRRRMRRGGGQREAISVHGEGEGRGDGALLPWGVVLCCVAREVDEIGSSGLRRRDKYLLLREEQPWIAP